MSNDSNLVKIYNTDGGLEKYIPREDLNYHEDIIYSVHTLVFTEDEHAILVKMPAIGTVYAGKFGSAFGSEQLKGEGDEDTIYRIMREKLNLEQLPEPITQAEPKKVVDKFFFSDDVLINFFSAYTIILDQPLLSLTNNPKDEFVDFDLDTLKKKIDREPEKFTPTFLEIWRRGKDNILEQLNG
ncbi:MAG: hypothetical protein ABEJ02_03655 [Candidatus Paceibacteria bacterium]